MYILKMYITIKNLIFTTYNKKSNIYNLIFTAYNVFLSCLFTRLFHLVQVSPPPTGRTLTAALIHRMPCLSPGLVVAPV